MNGNNWIRINIASETVSTIKFTSDLSKNFDSDLDYWKWFIIALHNAVQNIIVMSLRSINNIPIMEEKDSKKWLKAYWENKPLPKYKIKSLPQLFRQLKKNYEKFNLVDKFPPNSTLDWSLKQIHNYRNLFLHFIPAGVSLSKINIIRVGLDCMKLIKSLLFESGRINFNNHEYKILKNSIKTIDATLDIQKKKYNCCNDILY
ncbi:MAG: hypothetical protein A2455_17140 [Ignavibacteria bacterium RIFOXYC2_FULL_35_16]|nr:MAG: hypothetical protein A2058_05870 [Ignavibacteria bacterium GWA2_36_19]OGU53267.1 MAG: hypothetical protein A2006_11685 [Ignavibacteria bacterium GWC2_35_8]OGU56418.1 MAG: hypothetical protein A2X60_15335 [Ignavibacteria bacterium GWF2_35_20]OGU90844.1 MAG: hypothetical protein A3K31_12470 [Ignavibacteria bacterium RIFOXYA12_FULL_35_25]OGU91519.1 MAG: hypothetical protein A2492_02700 [Ignavibacteria bacterium RIFOXYC12_FULL_35_11]OGU94502.1 MAG: hypothetical protein A2347_03075 [Ignavib